MTKAELKQAKFRREYLKDGNGTCAAIAAGYAPRSAHVTASRLLRKANIAAPIRAAIDQYEVDAKRVTRELACCGFSNMADYVDRDGRMRDVTSLTREQAAAIREMKVTRRARADGSEEVETTVKLVDKVRPLQLLGQHTGIFKEGAADPVQFILIICDAREALRRAGLPVPPLPAPRDF